MSRRNVPLWLVFVVSQGTPLYWPYMFQLVTVVRGLSAAEFGMLKGIFYLVAITTEIPAGVAADRLGRRGTMLVGALLNGCACVLYTRAQSFEGFAVAEVLFGIGIALISGSDSALLYDSLRADGRSDEYLRFAARGRTAGLLSIAAALPFCDVFLVRDGDPVATYAATAGLCWVGVLAAAGLKEPPRGEARSARAITGGALREVASNRSLVALLVFTTGVFLLIRSSNSLFFNPLLAEKGVPVSGYGSMFAAMCVAGGLLAWRLDRIEAWLGPRTMLVAMPLLLMGMYAGLLATDGTLSAGLFLVSGAVAGIFSPIGQHLLNGMASASAHRATLLSIQSVCWRGSYAVASVTLGWTLDAWSLPTAVGILLALALVCLLAAAPRLLRARA